MSMYIRYFPAYRFKYLINKFQVFNLVLIILVGNLLANGQFIEFIFKQISLAGFTRFGVFLKDVEFNCHTAIRLKCNSMALVLASINALATTGTTAFPMNFFCSV